ncbi:TolC family protein [Sphingomonas sp. NFR15]|uniref:TolC family protein n=1 Tax=Sphingomonas sp. NFR15 TaxID=1566282 RepID=UPI0008895142|nr:TolC family protein [Sphingomonas sp. NFR15]SDA22330.1 Outer membrane protein TolC [Sphingomonas sp. NFR15]
MNRRVWMLLGLLPAACQSYVPAPLVSRPAALAPPDVQALSVAAAKIERPYLKPVTIDLAAPLDGNAVATLAVLNNPDLKALRERAKVADAQVFAARLLPDPTLNLGASRVLAGPDPLPDLVGALALDLNTLRTRGVQGAAAKAAADQVRLDLAWSEWQTAGAARLQAVRVLALSAMLEFAEASRDSARSMLDRNLRAAGRGDVAGDPVQSARLAAADAETKFQTARNDLNTAKFELTKLLGLPPATSLRLASIRASEEALDAAHLFVIARANRTDLRALEAGYASQEATVRKAIMDQFPTLGLTSTVNRDTAGNLIVGPAVDFTLPVWNRNRGGIETEKTTRAALRAEYDARLFQTRAEIAAAVAGIGIARTQRDTVLRDLPAAERYAVKSRTAANRGDLARSSADTAEQVLRDKRILLAQSEQAIAEQGIALELLTGTLREAWTK